MGDAKVVHCDSSKSLLFPLRSLRIQRTSLAVSHGQEKSQFVHITVGQEFPFLFSFFFGYFRKLRSTQTQICFYISPYFSFQPAL